LALVVCADFGEQVHSSFGASRLAIRGQPLPSRPIIPAKNIIQQFGSNYQANTMILRVFEDRFILYNWLVGIPHNPGKS